MIWTFFGTAPQHMPIAFWESNGPEDFGKPRRRTEPDGRVRDYEPEHRRRGQESYLVGTPKGRFTRLGKQLVGKPWRTARDSVQVKSLEQDDDLYRFAQSADRIKKERAMRRRQLKRLRARLKRLAEMDLTREERLMNLSAARSKAPAAWRCVDTQVDDKTDKLTDHHATRSGHARISASLIVRRT